MQITVLTPAVASAAGFWTPEHFSNPAYVVAAPDGVAYFETFESAKDYARTYGTPVRYL